MTSSDLFDESVMATVRSAEHWAKEMDRAVDAVSEAGAHVEIIDGNRAIAETLRECAILLRDLLARIGGKAAP